MDQIYKQLGGWGRYQAFVIALIFIPSFLGGCHTLITTFTLAAHDNRCYIPGFDNISNVSYSTPFHENMSDYLFLKPESQAGKLAYCHYCPFNESNLEKRIQCTAAMAKPCDHGRVFDRSQYRSTLSMEFDLACENSWRRELIRSIFAMGVLFGAAVMGILSDKIGRKRTFVLCSLSEILVFNAVTFTTNLYLYCILEFLGAAFQYGTYLSSFIIIMELVDGLPRTICGVVIQAYFTTGYVFVGLAAYLIRDWQWLQLLVSLMTFSYLPYYWLLPESIRWLLATGKRDEAQDVVDKACKMNKLPTFAVPQNANAIKLEEPQESVKLTDLFKHKKLATYSLIMFLIWFIYAVTYFGLTLNATDLPGNDYVNFILFGISELPGFVICIPMMERLGRKPSMILLVTLSGLSCITSGLLPHKYVAAVVATATIGKMCIAAAFAILYMYTAEVYPTVVRNTGVGFSSVCARIGSIIAPQIHLLAYYADEWLPIVIYGSSALVAAFSEFFLPETKGKPMPETIEDMINMTKEQNTRSQKSADNDAKSTTV